MAANNHPCIGLPDWSAHFDRRWGCVSPARSAACTHLLRRHGLAKRHAGMKIVPFLRRTFLAMFLPLEGYKGGFCADGNPRWRGGCRNSKRAPHRRPIRGQCDLPDGLQLHLQAAAMAIPGAGTLVPHQPDAQAFINTRHAQPVLKGVPQAVGGVSGRLAQIIISEILGHRGGPRIGLRPAPWTAFHPNKVARSVQ